MIFIWGREIQFDLTVLVFIDIFALAVVTTLLMRYLYRPNPHYSELYGDEIALFTVKIGTNGRYGGLT